MLSHYRLENEYESGLGKPGVVLIPRLANNSCALIMKDKVGKDIEQLSVIAQTGFKSTREALCSQDKDTSSGVVHAGSLAFYNKKVALAGELLTSK